VLRAIVLAAALLFASAATVQGAGDVPPVEHGTLPERLVVPSIGVDASVQVLGLDAEGGMASPEGPEPVGWYTFSPTPGNPGNTVFSGHRDWRTGVTGVFWRLSELVPGDRLWVVLADGTEVGYDVVLSVLVGPDDMTVEEIVGQTPEEIITLITCEGVFDPSTKEYDRRRVVWANRVVS
jgi:LPXTG-site transpeptidase (sortase) family protein